MKFCRGCRHFESKEWIERFQIKRWFRPAEWKEVNYGPILCCRAPAYDLVTGDNLNPRGAFGCNYRRTTQNDDCGPEGKLWEAKE